MPAPATDAPPTQLPVKAGVQAPLQVSAPSVAHVRPIFRKHHAHPQAVASRQQTPQCDLSKAPENIAANQEQIATVDYERQCYKELEAIQRAKLDALAEAGNKRGHRAADQASAKREPPSCQMSSPPAGASPSDAKLAALDYERQCYKKVVEFQRAELDAMQGHATAKHPPAQRATRPVSNSLMTAPASGH
jgi:hypothetical protein